MNNDNPSVDPSKLQRNSWEIEILISGGAFFALYQLSSSLYALSSKLDGDTVLYGGSVLVFLVAVLRILSIYFGIHLCVRAFWLSLVLLHKIYPQGINTDKFSLAEPFKSLTRQFIIEQRIAYSDKLSGLIFSWAVTFAIALFGICIAFNLCFIIAYSIIKISPDVAHNIAWRIIGSIIFSTFYLSLFLFLADTFFYGIFRRSKVLARIYYPIFFFWDKISLGFLWRPSLQVIFTNVKSRWKTSFLVLFVTVVIIFMTGDEDDYMDLFNARQFATEKIVSEEAIYLDKRTDETKSEQRGSFIQSDVIQDNFLKVFVNYNEYDDSSVDTLKTDKKYFSQLVRLSINDSVVVSPSWIGINRINGQKGIQTVIDISHLERKMHILKIERTYKKDPIVIPFWKQ